MILALRTNGVECREVYAHLAVEDKKSFLKREKVRIQVKSSGFLSVWILCS